MTVVLLLGQRVLTAVPILLTVSIRLFVALRMLPVDPAAMSDQSRSLDCPQFRFPLLALDA